MLQISQKVFKWTLYVYLIVIHVVMFLQVVDKLF